MYVLLFLFFIDPFSYYLFYALFLIILSFSFLLPLFIISSLFLLIHYSYHFLLLSRFPCCYFFTLTLLPSSLSRFSCLLPITFSLLFPLFSLLLLFCASYRLLLSFLFSYTTISLLPCCYSLLLFLFLYSILIACFLAYHSYRYYILPPVLAYLFLFTFVVSFLSALHPFFLSFFFSSSDVLFSLFVAPLLSLSLLYFISPLCLRHSLFFPAFSSSLLISWLSPCLPILLYLDHFAFSILFPLVVYSLLPHSFDSLPYLPFVFLLFVPLFSLSSRPFCYLLFLFLLLFFFSVFIFVSFSLVTSYSSILILYSFLVSYEVLIVIAPHPCPFLYLSIFLTPWLLLLSFPWSFSAFLSDLSFFFPTQFNSSFFSRTYMSFSYYLCFFLHCRVIYFVVVSPCSFFINSPVTDSLSCPICLHYLPFLFFSFVSVVFFFTFFLFPLFLLSLLLPLLFYHFHLLAFLSRSLLLTFSLASRSLLSASYFLTPLLLFLTLPATSFLSFPSCSSHCFVTVILVFVSRISSLSLLISLPFSLSCVFEVLSLLTSCRFAISIIIAFYLVFYCFLFSVYRPPSISSFSHLLLFLLLLTLLASFSLFHSSSLLVLFFFLPFYHLYSRLLLSFVLLYCFPLISCLSYYFYLFLIFFLLTLSSFSFPLLFSCSSDICSYCPLIALSHLTLHFSLPLF